VISTASGFVMTIFFFFFLPFLTPYCTLIWQVFFPEFGCPYLFLFFFFSFFFFFCTSTATVDSVFYFLTFWCGGRDSFRFSTLSRRPIGVSLSQSETQLDFSFLSSSFPASPPFFLGIFLFFFPFYLICLFLLFRRTCFFPFLFFFSGCVFFPFFRRCFFFAPFSALPLNLCGICFWSLWLYITG